MQNSKATGRGSDGILVEVYKACPEAKARLFHVVRLIFRNEDVPEEMAQGIVVTIFKKGSPDNMTKYRMIMLLQVATKILSCYLLKRVMSETVGFLPCSQTAYQAGRSTQDNVYVLAEKINAELELHEQCTISMIDFSAAFDSLSQIYLDQALGEAGASQETRGHARTRHQDAPADARRRKETPNDARIPQETPGDAKIRQDTQRDARTCQDTPGDARRRQDTPEDARRR